MFGVYACRQVHWALLTPRIQTYDGLRRRSIPLLYKALDVGAEDDRMKGAIWTLTSTSLGKISAICEV